MTPQGCRINTWSLVCLTNKLQEKKNPNNRWTEYLWVNRNLIYRLIRYNMWPLLYAICVSVAYSPVSDRLEQWNKQDIQISFIFLIKLFSDS